VKPSISIKVVSSGCIIFFCCISFVCIACFSLLALPQFNREKSQYGKNFNQEREKIGIPIIPNDWYSFSSSGRTIWQNPIWDTTTRTYGDGGEPLIIHYQKVVTIQNEHTVEETDIYLGDALEIIADNLVLEKIEITCTYNPDNIFDKKCSTMIKTEEVVYSGENIDKAIQILSEWNIPYP
jgi:hypothetical protein